MRSFKKIADTEDEKARARLLAHFEDNPQAVFYSRQLEVLFEREYFHWITNRALRRLIEEGRVHTEQRQLSTGSDIKLVWHKIDQYTRAATDGALGMQGEHLVLAAFARQCRWRRKSGPLWRAKSGQRRGYAMDSYCVFKSRTQQSTRGAYLALPAGNSLVALRQLHDLPVARENCSSECDHQIMISEVLIEVKENLSETSPPHYS